MGPRWIHLADTSCKRPAWITWAAWLPVKNKRGCRIHRVDHGRITTRIADLLGLWEGYGPPLDPLGRWQLQGASRDHVDSLAPGKDMDFHRIHLADTSCKRPAWITWAAWLPVKNKRGCRIYRADHGRITTRIADQLGFWERYGPPLDPPGR